MITGTFKEFIMIEKKEDTHYRHFDNVHELKKYVKESKFQSTHDFVRREVVYFKRVDDEYVEFRVKVDDLY